MRLHRHAGETFEVGAYTVVIPKDAGARDVHIDDESGHIVYQWDGKPVTHSFLPGPSQPFSSYVISDNPRVVPPKWGAAPPPPDNQVLKSTSGWDTTNDAPDLYVFLNEGEGYRGLRRDYLNLTGHTPMPPLAAFGFWDSRYYEYKQDEALSLMDEYRKRGYPIDFFVVDTDWRVNGSHGYSIETKDFPDMKKFIEDAHSRNIHLMYNDHPEPVADSALDPKEFAYRWGGLTELLSMGADVWWYDRNWMTHLHEPAPGISKEVWGARVYHDMTDAYRPDRRPLIMSNVEGIDNGTKHYAPHPAFHRFPIWWTGDTYAYWSYLKRGIANGVDGGVESLLPYVNEDLGGHQSHPTPELYVRYLQYGTLSPITRIHCTKGEDRHPWIFGPEAENIVRDYIKLRYRLLPTIYGAARRAFDDGTPLLRRCDLEWPNFPEAADDQQFMLGDDLLVAPTNESTIPTAATIPANLLHTPDGHLGLQGEYFANANLDGKPVFTKADATVDFDWKAGSPGSGIPKENFSIRWTGKLGPVPESGTYQVAVDMDDGCRLFVDGKNVIDDWRGHAEITDSVPVEMEAGKTYDIRLEYLQLGYDDVCRFQWVLPSQIKPIAMRTLWIPPGEWEDVWTGESIEGPKTLTVPSPLWHEAMYARRGGIILQAPEMQYTSEKPWDPVIADLYPGSDMPIVRHLYEDDGESNSYLNGHFRITDLHLDTEDNRISCEINGARGNFNGAISHRQWVLRFHLKSGQTVAAIHVDGRRLSSDQFAVIEPTLDHVPMPFLGEGAVPGPKGGPVLEFKTSSAEVRHGHRVQIELNQL
jgi:alpha-glucosidase (family GH31 glycosyl hydrolase)